MCVCVFVCVCVRASVETACPAGQRAENVSVNHYVHIKYWNNNNNNE